MTDALDPVPAAPRVLPRGGQLDDERFATRHRVLLYILLANLPVLALLAVVGRDYQGHRFTGPTWVELAMVAVLALAGGAARGRLLRSSAVSLGLLSCAAMLIELTGGQTSMHFYFFVVLALVAFYQEWVPYLLAVAFTAVHHIGMSLAVDPRAVFSDPLPQHRPVLWALIHAGFVLAACAANVLFWKFAEDSETAARRTAAAAERAALDQARLRSEAAQLQEDHAQESRARLQQERDDRARLQRELGTITESSSLVDQSVREAAAAVEEFSASISQISASTRTASAVAAEAVAAEQTGRHAILSLGEASEKINNVVRVIGNIADQTNLLALNATIEASRAGAAGKGFAVVASEVKDLAQETARSTGEIGTIVSSIQDETARVVAAFETISDIITRISGLQEGISGTVEHQTRASVALSATMSDASRGSAEIARGLDGLAVGRA